MGIREYHEKIEEWVKKYGRKNPSAVIDLRKVRLSKCVKCRKSRKRMNRHHKGNDLLWAHLYPDEFAPRYIEFHPDDIAMLCRSCHKKIHLLYDQVLYHFFLEWAIDRTENINHTPPIEVCKAYQTLCIERFEKWMTEK